MLVLYLELVNGSSTKTENIKVKEVKNYTSSKKKIAKEEPKVFEEEKILKEKKNQKKLKRRTNT